jgi:hypothetical protein
MDHDVLYHYTDPGGLLGIVKDQCIWASDVWFMNDAREARYGEDVLKRALESATEDKDERAVRAATLAQLAQLSDQDEIAQTYIACLSKNGDQLSQWRAYGRPRGFSIGFDREALQRLCIMDFELDKPSLREVCYNTTVQDRRIIDLFRSFQAQLTSSGDPWSQPNRIGRMFILEALWLVPGFKHPAFVEEAEVRLHILHDPATGVRDDLNFRNATMGLTPYVVIDLRDRGADQMTAIREVIIGPQPNQGEALRAAQQLLDRHGIENVKVRLSDIPIRPYHHSA